MNDATPLPTGSALHAALADFVRHDTPAARTAVLDALATAVLYVCVGVDRAVERTGYEPRFTVARVAGRALVLGAAPGGGRSMLWFLDRAGAEAWSARVAGFAAEPITDPLAVAVAELADVELAVLDPLAVAFVIDRPTLAWRCPRSERPGPSFAACAQAWIGADTAETFAALVEAYRHGVFYVQVVRRGRGPVGDAPRVTHAALGGRRFMLDVDAGVAFLTANTERGVVEGWCDGTVYECLALDGPGLLDAAAGLGADVGVMVGHEKTLAIGADDRHLWPRRALTAGDL